MAYPHNDEMVLVGGRFWWFPGRQISVALTLTISGEGTGTKSKGQWPSTVRTTA
jgi:hypothetical protein